VRHGGVADVGAVTDTHPLLFHAAGGRRLGDRAAELFARCERRDTIIYVPAMVIWEIGLLARAGRVHLKRSAREFADDLFSNPAFQPLDATMDHMVAATDLVFTRDPFDALIVATAQALSLPLITRDVVIRGSGLIPVIW
jgi:PIN domain nuclease of toxin-antitoxin system